MLRVSLCDRAVPIVCRPLSTFYLVYAVEATFFSLKLMKLCQNVCLNEILHDFGIESFGVKTKSPGQIVENPCVRSRGHILSLICIKLGQNVCLDEISDEFEKGSCGVKN